MNLAYIGVIIFFAAYIANRFVMTEATKEIDDSLKLKLFDAFSKRNNYSVIFVFVIVLLYIGAMQFLPQYLFQITIGYLLIFVGYLVFRFVTNFKKLEQLELPAEYIKSFVLGYTIYAIGFLALASGVLYSWKK